MAKKKDDAAEGEDEGKKGGKLKLIIMILPTVLLIVGAVYFLVLAPKSDSATTSKSKAKASVSAEAGSEGADGENADGEATDESEAEASPSSTYVEGKMVVVDPITINLANGHYLKLGMALQATAEAGEEVSGSKALDAAIALYSGMTIDELATTKGRDESRKKLLKAIKKAYEKKVYEVYFTTFVMQ